MTRKIYSLVINTDRSEKRRRFDVSLDIIFKMNLSDLIKTTSCEKLKRQISSLIFIVKCLNKGLLFKISD